MDWFDYWDFCMSLVNLFGMNIFVLVISLYLCQYVDNLVYWQQWMLQVLVEVVVCVVLILLFVGYVVCYWCYVMVYELFDDDEVVVVMNVGFVCIKVDWEEWFDIDVVYMNVIVVFIGQGGWLMICFFIFNGWLFFCGIYYLKVVFL